MANVHDATRFWKINMCIQSYIENHKNNIDTGPGHTALNADNECFFAGLIAGQYSVMF